MKSTGGCEVRSEDDRKPWSGEELGPQDQEMIDGGPGVSSTTLRGGAMLFWGVGRGCVESSKYGEWGRDSRGAAVTQTFCGTRQWSAAAKTLTVPWLCP